MLSTVPHRLMAVAAIWASIDAVQEKVTLGQAINTFEATGVPYIMSGDTFRYELSKQRKTKK